MEKEDKLMNLKFLMFENETNICWLDASISLIVHNRTFKKLVECSPKSKINETISAYHEAINILNNSDNTVEQRLLKTKKILLAIQNSTLEYLKQFLKFKPGEPDSAFCALLNLIYHDKSNIKEHLNVSWIWSKQCSNCHTSSKSSACLKPIITLAKVNSFNPECPSSIYTCTCKLEQEMKLIYKEIPACLIFHFEKGAGKGSRVPLTFFIKHRKYQLTGIVILEKGSDPEFNHFVTWIRNPSINMWLECNDLNPGIVSFSPSKIKFDLKDLYICVFEACDSLNKITNNEISDEKERVNETKNVEVIDISDDVDDSNNTSADCKINDFISSKAFRNGGTSIQNMKMYNIGKSKESEKLSNISRQKISSIRHSPNKYILKKSKVVDYYTGMKSTDASSETKVDITNNLFSNNELQIEAKCKNNYRQGNFDDKPSETKELKSEPIAYSLLKVTDSSIRTKKGTNSNSLCFYNVTEDKSVSGIIHEEQPSEKKTACSSEISSTIFKGTTEKRKNKVNKYDVNKSQVKMKEISYDESKLQIKMKEISLKKNEDKYSNENKLQEKMKEISLKSNEDKYNEKKLLIKMKEIPLKKNEDKCVNLCEEKIKRIEDKEKESSNKEKNDVKCISSSEKEKHKILKAQTASTSVADNEITKTTLQGSKRTSKSKNPNCCGKKAKVVDCEIVDDQEVSIENASNELNDEALRNIIDPIFDRLFAVFFKNVIEKH